MKTRFCDQCRQEIPAGEDYMKVSLQKHVDKRQILTHRGDLYTTCWNKDCSKIEFKKISGGKK